MKHLVLVTGGNRGIGRTVCRALLSGGAGVVLTSRSEDTSLQVAAELSREFPEAILVAEALDVSSEASAVQLAARLKASGVRLAAVVNNAGASFNGFDDSVVRRTLDTNTYGPMRVTDALTELLEDGAKVVNVSSGMGELRGLGATLSTRFRAVTSRAELRGVLDDFVAAVASGRHREQGWPSNAYSVSKAALNVFTQLLANEQPRLVVNSVCPGWVRTDMGGSSAPRSVEQGASGIVWAATLPTDGPSGGFFRDGKALTW